MGSTGDMKALLPKRLPVAGMLGPFSDEDTDIGNTRVHIRELGLSAGLNPAHRLHSPATEPLRFPRRLPAKGTVGKVK